MSATDELLPCPFCGSEGAWSLAGDCNVQQVDTYVPGKSEPLCHKYMWRVTCPCGGMGPHKDTPELAIAAWNRRAEQ